MLFVEIDVLTAVRAASILEDEFERLFELVLIVASAAPTLDDDCDTLKEDACSPDIEVFTAFRAASTLLELDERERLDVPSAERVVFV